MMLAARRPPDDHSAGAADRVNLKDVLGQVEADGRDLHRGGSKLVLRDSTTLALRRREREPSTPSALTPTALPSGRSALGRLAHPGRYTWHLGSPRPPPRPGLPLPAAQAIPDGSLGASAAQTRA